MASLIQDRDPGDERDESPVDDDQEPALALEDGGWDREAHEAGELSW